MSLKGGGRDLFSFKRLKINDVIVILVALMDRVNVIHGVCALKGYRMTAKKGVLQYEVCQHWISLKGGKRDLYSAKY
jgi:hypothetical protein